MTSRKWLSVLIMVPAVVVIGRSVVGSQSTTAEEPAASDGATSNEEAALVRKMAEIADRRKPTLVREPEGSALLIVAEKLRAVFRNLEPQPTTTIREGSLVAGWKTRKFMVHGDKRGGVFAENATEEVGPGPEGFLLSVQSEPVGTLRAAVLPTTGRGPYWDSHIDVYKPEDSSEQLYWELKYGMRTDKDLIRRIEDALGGLRNGLVGAASRYSREAERRSIIDDANRAIHAHMQTDPAKRNGDEIAKELWGESIARLNPVRVYDDRVNVAIVLREEPEHQEGLYISTPISSYAPQPGDRFNVLDKLSQPDDQSFGTLFYYKANRQIDAGESTPRQSQ